VMDEQSFRDQITSLNMDTTKKLEDYMVLKLFSYSNKLDEIDCMKILKVFKGEVVDHLESEIKVKEQNCYEP